MSKIYSDETEKLKQLDRIEKILLKHHQRAMVPDMLYSIQLLIFNAGMILISLCMFMLTKSQSIFVLFLFYLVVSIPILLIGITLDVLTMYTYKKRLKEVDEMFKPKRKKR